MWLRCTLMFPVQNMGESTQQKKSVSEIAPSCVCREQAVIPALNRASAYWLLQSIDNSSRKEGGEEGGSEKKKFASPPLSLSLSLTDVTMHTSALNMLSLVWPRAILYIYKALHYFLQLAAYEWCARDVGFVFNHLAQNEAKVCRRCRFFFFFLELDEWISSSEVA